MLLGSRWISAPFVLTALLLRCVSADGAALSITPSTSWVGNDGSWSPLQLLVGTPAQWVSVLVSTASAETWVIGEGGCDGTAICASLRGGLFNSTQSSTWTPEGFYDLGLDTQLGFSGYGGYGLDDVTFGTTGVTLTDTIISTINSTEYWIGFFGVGIVPGNFSTFTATSPISDLVEKEDVIPSHSYGYTAGAKYQLKGEPVSLTLGGYDENRFVPHDTTFQLNPSQQPELFIDSISVSSSLTSSNWSTPVSLLSRTDRVYATVDSSTPYLWLPPTVCERFASSLGLTYNDSLNLYTFDGNASQHGALQNSDLTFTFNLSDISTSTDIVTITLPYAAFDLQLTYPAIPNTSYGDDDATKNYFPLRRATSESQYTIGRAFLQEAYIITDYESNTFSLHQAVHIEDPIMNTSIIDIAKYVNSTFSDGTGGGSMVLSTSVIVGIAFGSTAAVAIIAFIVFYLRFRKHRRAPSADDKDSTSSASPRSILRHFRRRSRPSEVHESPGSNAYAMEMATESHERYELPASLPAELESESITLAGTTDGSSSPETRNLSAYERARRKLEHQQSVHFHSDNGLYLSEKNDGDASLVDYSGTSSVPDIPSPLSSPLADCSHGGFSATGTSSQPSPVSPDFRQVPTTGPGPIPLPKSPPPTYQRITPGNAIYAGRIPADVQLPENVPRLVGSDGRTIYTATEPGSSTFGSYHSGTQSDPMGNIYDADSIEVDTTQHPAGRVESERDSHSPHSRGPNWPLDEEDSGTVIIGGRVVRDEDESKFRMEDIQALRADMQTRDAVDPHNLRRISGEEIVHVPVPAENRFSWESDAGRGTTT